MEYANPDMIFCCLSKPKEFERLVKKIKKDLGLTVREIRFFDVPIFLNKKDKIINYFKHFILCKHWAVRRDDFLNNFIVKRILKELEKRGWGLVNFKENDWRADTTHPLLGALVCPLFVQSQFSNCETEKERKAMSDLYTFKSKGYKPILKEKEDKDMKFQENGKEEVI